MCFKSVPAKKYPGMRADKSPGSFVVRSRGRNVWLLLFRLYMSSILRKCKLFDRSLFSCDMSLFLLQTFRVKCRRRSSTVYLPLQNIAQHVQMSMFLIYVALHYIFSTITIQLWTFLYSRQKVLKQRWRSLHLNR